MNCYLSANHVLYKDYRQHVESVTDKVLQASLIPQAKELKRFKYLNSAQISKDQVARQFAQEHQVKAGLVWVLQCVEPCWSFGLDKKPDGKLTVVGQQRKCSFLYHYYLHPQFGWMFVRLQTWFPFEIEVYLNGREWFARQLDSAGLSYRRSDNKFLWLPIGTKPSSCSISNCRRTGQPCWTSCSAKCIPCIRLIWVVCRWPTTGRCIKANGPRMWRARSWGDSTQRHKLSEQIHLKIAILLNGRASALPGECRRGHVNLDD